MGLTLTALMTVSMFAGCGAGENSSENSDPGGEDNVFTIAYAPNESTAESADARNGLAKDLSEALGCEVEEIQASDYNAIIEALRTGNADMAYMGSQALALGVERTDLEPIVMKAEEGDPEKLCITLCSLQTATMMRLTPLKILKVRQWLLSIRIPLLATWCLPLKLSGRSPMMISIQISYIQMGISLRR